MRLAAKKEVAGWVRNRPDGAVEAVFEGAERAVGELVEWCRQGPPRARVAGVETTHEEPAGLTRFEIAR